MRVIPLTQCIPAGVIEAFRQPGDMVLLIETAADYANAPADVQAIVNARPTRAQQDAAQAEAAQQAAKDAADAASAKGYAKLAALAAMTPAEVQAWVQANVTTLAQARDAIATLATAVSVLARRL